MIHLGLDIGSSSVKAGLLRNGKVVGQIVHAKFLTNHDGVKVEVDPAKLLAAVTSSIRDLGDAAHKADLIALSVMSPAWVAMDSAGKPVTPIVTHQDRRSVEVARDLVKRVGQQRYLKLAGNLPFPGGISATTWAWYRQNEPARLKRADLAGHLNTFLIRQFTGARAIDPANASFTGLYATPTQSGWVEELCDAVGASLNQLPQVHEANVVAGNVTSTAARRFGLREGTPVVTGIVDTSSAMLLIGAANGQLLNVSGSTDVLALCVDHARPHEKLLTRALGVGRKWMSVSTIAAAGSSLNWVKDQFFCDMEPKAYWKMLTKLASQKRPADQIPVRFEPYLAGERASIEQRRAAFTELTLSSTREDLATAVVESLAQASAARLELLKHNKVKMKKKVIVSGGVQDGLDKILHRDWPGHWTFKPEEEATLRGLATLVPN